ncbi:LytR/AlgR family response regulator transcription factor [Sediminicola sp. 1XM1-17]|uniref:LytR/AlgR family response regulator transcription factor n=1 Tax=Sediminicola sp. 1XM1-17 TaxID=3127702 RepID=UPI003076EFAC
MSQTKTPFLQPIDINASVKPTLYLDIEVKLILAVISMIIKNYMGIFTFIKFFFNTITNINIPICTPRHKGCVFLLTSLSFLYIIKALTLKISKMQVRLIKSIAPSKCALFLGHISKIVNKIFCKVYDILNSFFKVQKTLMKTIYAMIISQEKETLQILSKFAKENSMIVTIDEGGSNLKEGISIIKERKPQVVFLTTSTDNLAQFDLLHTLDFNIPKFIFISDDKTMAYNAFKLNAVDFLLKPMNFNDIIIALYKAIKVIEMEISYQNEKVKDIDTINLKFQNDEYLAISSMDKIELVKIEDIVYCKADGKYTEFILLGNKKILSSKNLGEYKNILDHNYFFRIHHSYIVNIKQIVGISKKDGLYCEFSNGALLPVAKRRQEGFAKFIRL